MRQTTVGWKLLVQWNDGSHQWIALKILKESNPVQVAEYAVARGIGNKPAFAWWIPYTLRKRRRGTAVLSHVPRPNHAGRKNNFFFFQSQPPQSSTVT
jgi:hypothetical protein